MRGPARNPKVIGAVAVERAEMVVQSLIGRAERASVIEGVRLGTEG